MLVDSIAAWAITPLLLCGIGLGLGLLVERALGVSLPNTLLVPVGVCLAIVAVMPGYQLGFGAEVAAGVVVLGAAAGLLLERRGLLRRLRPGPASAAALAAYALYLAPVVLTGRWTWTGYNFVNDTSVQLLLAAQLGERGVDVPAPGISTTAESVRVYLTSSYPLGAHGLLATLASLIPAPLAALYQPFIATMAGLATAPLYFLARRASVVPAAAGVAAFAAVAANLVYQYGLQGSIKELAMVLVLATSAAIGREMLTGERPGRLALALGVCLAAALSVYSSAAVPYVALLAAGLGVAAALQRGSDARLLLRRAAVPGAVLLGVAAIPALLGLGVSLNVVTHTFSGAQGPQELGQLLRPLPLAQSAGVWLNGEYRLSIPFGVAATATGVAIAATAGLVVLGAATLLRRRETGALLPLFATAITLALLSTWVSPYALGKALVLLSPAVVLVAAVGAWALSRRVRPLGMAVGVALLGAILLSDAYAYHDVRLAPTERMQALQDVGDRYSGRGLLLVNEFEEFAKYFMRNSRINVPTEAITQRHVQLRRRQEFFNRWIDLDDQKLGYVSEYPFVVTRRGPGLSRPPANYRLDYGNRYYVVWRRERGVRVVRHMPLGGVNRAAAVPSCGRVAVLARAARPGDHLVAAPARAVAMLDTVKDKLRSPGWPPDPAARGAVITATPGQAHARVHAPAGRYRVWVRGSFGRPVEAWVDGRKVGEVDGVNSPGQWLSAGTVRVRGGRHRLRLWRQGGGLAPGDGFDGQLGPLVLARIGDAPLVRVPAGRFKLICGREFDWVDLVRGRG